MKLKHQLAIGTTLLVVLSSCATKKVEKDILVPVPYDDGTASFGARNGKPTGAWQSRGTSNVLEPETVEAYPIARYQDPNNPNILHERHFVYRKQAQKWNLTPNTSEQINLGNVPEQSRIIDGRINERISETAIQNAIILQQGLIQEQRKAIAQLQNGNSGIKQLEANQIAMSKAIKTLGENQKKLAELKKMLEGRRSSKSEDKPSVRQSGNADLLKQ